MTETNILLDNILEFMMFEFGFPPTLKLSTVC